jgi:SOS-response transcriptional repressor LexA
MEPDYPDGSTIEFQVVRIDGDGFEVGRDYVICKNDDTATFKRLAAAHSDTISLAALNQKDYPGLIVVSRQEIGRVARAVAKVIPVGPGKVPKIKTP